LVSFVKYCELVLLVLIHNNKNSLNKYNDCTVLNLKLTRFKGQITSLALQGSLKDKTLDEIDALIKEYNDVLSNYLQIKA